MRILVVEDERDLNRVITRHLKKNNYSVDSCFDGQEGLDFIIPNMIKYLIST